MKKYKIYLEELVKKQSKSFTKTEKIIANFFIENSNEIPFYSIQELSEKLGLARASIQRFVKKIGYDGFYSFRKEATNNLKNNIAPLEKFKTKLFNNESEIFPINQIAENEVNNINFTLNHIDRKAIDKFVNYVLNAHNIYIAGMNLSSYLAGITAYLLQRLGLNAFYLNQPGVLLVEQVMNITPKDILIAFSLPKYSQSTIEAAKYASKQNAKVIAFTNSITAPIVEFSDLQIIIKTDSYHFSNSLSPIIVMIFGLMSEIASLDKKRSIKAINRVISLR